MSAAYTLLSVRWHLVRRDLDDYRLGGDSYDHRHSTRFLDAQPTAAGNDPQAKSANSGSIGAGGNSNSEPTANAAIAITDSRIIFRVDWLVAKRALAECGVGIDDRQWRFSVPDRVLDV